MKTERDVSLLVVIFDKEKNGEGGKMMQLL